MSKSKNEFGLILKLLAGIVIGALIGFAANENVMQVVMSLKYVLGQIIFYTVPLVIIAFIAPAITRLGQNASRMLIAALVIAYISSVGAATMSCLAGYAIIPHLSVPTAVAALHPLPDVLFKLDIPPVMPVMTALVTAVLIGIASLWTRAEIMV